MNMPAEIAIDDDPRCAARRLRLWRDAVGDHMADVDLRAAGDLPARLRLRGSLRLRRFDAATIARIDAGAQRILRTRDRIRRSRSDAVFVTVALAGECRLEQAGRRSVVRAGSLCVYDTAEPYAIETSPDFASVLVGLDRRAIEARFGDLRPLLGPLADGAASRVAWRYWRHLAAEAGMMERPCAEAMASAGVDILAAALRPGHAHAPAGSERALARARAAIADGHGAPRFSPREVAAAAGLSLRRLQEIFAEAGDAPAAAIRRARLETARRLLADPRFAALPIKTLMAEAGFRHPAHFARAFSAAYGLRPIDVRTRSPAPERGGEGASLADEGRRRLERRSPAR